MIVGSIITPNYMTKVYADETILEVQSERSYIKPVNASETISEWGSSATADGYACVFQFKSNNQSKGYLFITKPDNKNDYNFNNIKGNTSLRLMTSPFKRLNAKQNTSLYTCAERIANNDTSFNNGGEYYVQIYKGQNSSNDSSRIPVAYLFIPKSYMNTANNIINSYESNLIYFAPNTQNMALYNDDQTKLSTQATNLTSNNDADGKVNITWPSYIYHGTTRTETTYVNSNGSICWPHEGVAPKNNSSAWAYIMFSLTFRKLSYMGTYIDMTFEYGKFYTLKETVNPYCNKEQTVDVKAFYNSNNSANSLITTNKKVTVFRNANNHRESYCTYEAINDTQHNRITKCVDCNKEIASRVVENHAWDTGTITKEATCTENGIRTYTCTECKKTKTEEIKALGHISDNNFVTEKAPTCTEKGIAKSHCARCKCALDSKELSALGHNYKEVTIKATYDKEGCVKKVCDRCKKEEIIKTIPKLTKQSTTEQKKEETKVTVDENGKIDGKSSTEFTQDGVKYKVVVNPDKSVSVYRYDTTTKSWVLVPQSGYTTTTNNDNTKTIVITKKTSKLGRVAIKSLLSKKKRTTTIKYKKVKNAKKYQIQIATNKKFTKNTKKYSTKKLTYTIKKLKSKKTYYIRVRAYSKVNGKLVYGKWSK
ncbi:MAG: hypothetical protein VZS44_11170, partial [Bacilli bacterium]|nr:hypothetical protein [Bacilli bacterium]